MDPRRIGVFLQDEVFAGQLAGYWSRKAPQYRFAVFGSAEELGQELEAEPLYLLITERVCLAAWEEARFPGRSRIGRFVFLSEEQGSEEEAAGAGGESCAGAARDNPAWEAIPEVLRYQSADRILAEAIGMSRETEVLSRPERAASVSACEAGALACSEALPPGEGPEVIGVYSPVGRCGKSRFALALGKVSGERTRTLYLNLEVFSDLYEWLAASGKGDFSDLLYYLKQGRLTGEVWEQLTCPLQGLSVVGPAVNPEDIMGILPECCREILASAGAAGYDRVIWDIGCSHPDPAGLLALCSRVYAPVTEEENSRLKWEHFAAYLRGTGREALLERIETVRLPEAGSRYEVSGLPDCGEELETFVRRLSCWKN